MMTGFKLTLLAFVLFSIVSCNNATNSNSTGSTPSSSTEEQVLGEVEYVVDDTKLRLLFQLNNDNTYFISNQVGDVNEAAATCRDNGMTLLSLDTSSENYFIKKNLAILSKDVYLGEIWTHGIYQRNSSMARSFWLSDPESSMTFTDFFGHPALGDIVRSRNRRAAAVIRSGYAWSERSSSSSSSSSRASYGNQYERQRGGGGGDGSDALRTFVNQWESRNICTRCRCKDIPACKHMPTCDIRLLPCRTGPRKCVVESPVCKAVRGDCAPNCPECELIPPKCAIVKGPCHVTTPPCHITMQPQCHVDAPPCHTERPPCSPVEPKHCKIKITKVPCKKKPAYGYPSTPCIETECPFNTTCRTPIDCTPIVCESRLLVCEDHPVHCPNPVTVCPTEKIVCQEPKVTCPEPTIKCPEPQIKCSRPIAICPVAVACPGVITHCSEAKVKCDAPHVECPPPEINCTKPPLCDTPRLPHLPDPECPYGYDECCEDDGNCPPGGPCDPKPCPTGRCPPITERPPRGTTEEPWTTTPPDDYFSNEYDPQDEPYKEGESDTRHTTIISAEKTRTTVPTSSTTMNPRSESDPERMVTWCIALSDKHEYQWTIQPCDVKRRFICELGTNEN